LTANSRENQSNIKTNVISIVSQVFMENQIFDFEKKFFKILISLYFELIFQHILSLKRNRYKNSKKEVIVRD
jgi:hypothetical protein